MADKKISDLPLTPAVNLDDTFEKSRHNAVPSERMTTQQLVTFLQTALASLTLTSGKVVLNSDGSAEFANNLIHLSLDGGATFASGFIALQTTGGAQFATGKMVIGSDGSVTLDDGVGKVILKSNGDPSTFEGGVGTGPDGAQTIVLHADGSASFASGTITFASDGSATFVTNNIFFQADGSASFQGGSVDLGVDTAGQISVFTGYAVNTTKVVGAQQAAIADATGAGDVVARVNDILAALRTHGLIAT